MVAKARNLGAGGFARLQQRQFRRDVDFNAIDEDFRHCKSAFARPRMDDLSRRRKWANVRCAKRLSRATFVFLRDVRTASKAMPRPCARYVTAVS
jgi:hypothetical protein